GLRADFEKQLAAITRRNLIEAGGAIRDEAREHIEAPRRALRIGERADVRGQGEPFFDTGDIDAAHFENRALRQVDFMQRELCELVFNRLAGRGKEARADAEGARAQPEIEARG